MNVTIVVLHYETLSDSAQCLNSIFQLNKQGINLSVVVVDNFSINGKFEKIKDLYDVYYIKSPKNLGFSCGNNLGIYFAKYNLSPDYVVVVNNDVVFNDSEFLQKLCENAENEKADIIGPSIFSPDLKINQNPIFDLYLDKKKVKGRLIRFKILKFLLLFNLDVFFQKIYLKLKANNNIHVKDSKDYKLHGACLIFTKKYLSQYDGFNPDTFMYFEEDILKYIAERDNLNMVYNPQIELIHKEAASTNYILSNNRKKRKFVYVNSIYSLKKLLKLMKQKANE